MKRTLTCSLVLLLVALPLALTALDAPRSTVYNLRSLGMGGAKLAFADDQYAPINNPAAPSLLKGGWISLVQAQAVISGDFLALWDNKDAFQAMASTGEISNDVFNYVTRLKLNIASTPAYVALLNVLPFNLNLVLYDTLRVKFTSNPDLPLPTWNLSSVNDTVALVNFSLPILNFKFTDIFLGVNAKLIHRMDFRKDRVDLFYLYNLAALELGQLDVRRALALGFDIGLIARSSDSLVFALTLTDATGTKFNWSKVSNPDDIFGPASAVGDDHSWIQPSLNAGVKLRIGTIIPLLLEDLVVAADLENIGDRKVNMFLKTHVGAEFGMLGGLFKIRAGMYQGWLTAGLGIDIPVLPLELVFAYWAEELGEKPGQKRLDNFGLTLNILW